MDKIDARKLSRDALKALRGQAIRLRQELGPPRQNRCRSHRTLYPEALMEEQVGQLRTSIQGQGRGAVVAV